HHIFRKECHVLTIPINEDTAILAIVHGHRIPETIRDNHNIPRALDHLITLPERSYWPAHTSTLRSPPRALPTDPERLEPLRTVRILPRTLCSVHHTSQPPR